MVQDKKNLVNCYITHISFYLKLFLKLILYKLIIILYNLNTFILVLSKAQKEVFVVFLSLLATFLCYYITLKVFNTALAGQYVVRTF